MNKQKLNKILGWIIIAAILFLFVEFLALLAGEFFPLLIAVSMFLAGLAYLLVTAIGFIVK